MCQQSTALSAKTVRAGSPPDAASAATATVPPDVSVVVIVRFFELDKRSVVATDSASPSFRVHPYGCSIREVVAAWIGKRYATLTTALG